MHKKTTVVALITLLACAASVSAQQILIDFGTSSEENVGPDVQGRYWNNFSSTAVQTISKVLNHDRTTVPGVTLQITDSFYRTSTNSRGGEKIYTADATTDFFYLRRGADDRGQIKISGLDSSGDTAYDFKFYITTNRKLPQKFITDYTVTGASSSTTSLEAIGNMHSVASINGMIPTAAGELDVTVAINSNSDEFGAISVMEVIGRTPGDPVTPNPEPIVKNTLVAPGAWTIALIPDTQYYSQSHPGIFSAQTIWLRDNARRYNIRFALHLGDITNKNTEDQWLAARESMAVLDGHLPYFFVPGNHDYGPNGNASTRDTLMNDHFTHADYSSRPYFGGAKETEKMDNSYHLISAGGYDWIILCLEWGPTDGTIAWADKILIAHPDCKAILVTHAYMYYDGTRYDHKGPNQSWNPHGDYKTPGNPNDGQELWDKLVKKHDFVLTVNGHVLGDGTGFLTSPNLAGQNVHQMLVNYQHLKPFNGNGYLRLLTVNPDGTVQATSYSPVYNQFNSAVDQRFTFDFEWYSPADENGNGTPDYYDKSIDSDGDGLNNYAEFMQHGTLPNETDSDGDGLADGLEIQIGTNPSVSDKSTVDAILDNINLFGDQK